MARPSSISKLPNQIREKIGQLRDGGCTIDEILEHLNKLSVDVSRSALGRHIKKTEQVAERIRKSRMVAEAVGREFGDNEASRVARTNMEIMHSLLMKLMVGDDDEEREISFDPKEAMFLATALEKLSKASKSDLETQIKAAVEKERREAMTQAADKAETIARKQGLSAETVNAIKAGILGIET